MNLLSIGLLFFSSSKVCIRRHWSLDKRAENRNISTLLTCTFTIECSEASNSLLVGPHRDFGGIERMYIYFQGAQEP